MLTRSEDGTAPVFDHAVYAGPNLEALIADLEEKTGVRPVFGGEHEALGTHNALLGLGPRRYLELLAPVPGRTDGFAGLLSSLPAPRLFMWAVRVGDVAAFIAGGTRAGLAMGEAGAMSRTPPGAPAQHWELSTGGADVYGSVVPFGICWKTPVHPADALAPGCALTALRARHPERERIAAAYAALDIDVTVETARAAGLAVSLETPRGRLELA